MSEIKQELPVRTGEDAGVKGLLEQIAELLRHVSRVWFSCPERLHDRSTGTVLAQVSSRLRARSPTPSSAFTGVLQSTAR